MIKHIVMWKFKDQSEGKTKKEILEFVKEGLLRLPEIIPEIKAMDFHTDHSTKDDNFDAVLVTEFESFEDLAIYTTHPEHQKVSQFVAKVKLSRASVDYCM